MAEFCKCGSLLVAGKCSNKSCSLKTNDKQPVVKSARKSAAAGNAPAKLSKTRRASKCITYNLYDTEKEEGGNL